MFLSVRNRSLTRSNSEEVRGGKLASSVLRFRRGGWGASSGGATAGGGSALAIGGFSGAGSTAGGGATSGDAADSDGGAEEGSVIATIGAVEAASGVEPVADEGVPDDSATAAGVLTEPTLGLLAISGGAGCLELRCSANHAPAASAAPAAIT